MRLHNAPASRAYPLNARSCMRTINRAKAPRGSPVNRKLAKMAPAPREQARPALLPSGERPLAEGASAIGGGGTAHPKLAAK
jgi:hypothetical protein